MTDKNLQALAEQEQARARKVVDRAGVYEAWESVGATVNLVGSLSNGLLIKLRDVDFHIYSDPFSLESGFAAMAKIAARQEVTRMSFANLMNTDEKCVEWHAWIHDDAGREWQLDMIHIMPDSQYVGTFEAIADRIAERISPEEKMAVLEIKHSLPDGESIAGALIYKAVMNGGVRDLAQMRRWLSENKTDGIIAIDL